MRLIHNQIPLEFLNTLPEGIKFINKHGKEFLVVEELYCPNGHNLMVETVKLHGEPSVKIDVKLKNPGGQYYQEGSFFIDAFWGSHDKLYNFIPIIKEEPVIADAFCPSCGACLMADDKCSVENCSTIPHIVFLLPGGKNKIFVCGRLGCPGHRIDIIDMPHIISETVSDINFFGEGADDIFRGI
ncbi:MAG: hypothetical protein AB1798_11140 [Spirochaetota bacterium]